jgi:hypothetical protein
VPNNVAKLKGRNGQRLGNESKDNEMINDDINMRCFVASMYEVLFRYSEYCITAPLLFIAIMCLLTVDSPAWLFLIGYWLIQACNAIGIAYHATLCSEIIRDYSTYGAKNTRSIADWFTKIGGNGTWYVLPPFPCYLITNYFSFLILLSFSGTTRAYIRLVLWKGRGSA